MDPQPHHDRTSESSPSSLTTLGQPLDTTVTQALANVQGKGLFDLSQTNTRFHFLAHDWERLNISFKDCSHSLTLNSTNASAQCQAAKSSSSLGNHNKAVTVPTQLLHRVSPDALMNYCLDQERSMLSDDQGQCLHNNSRNKLVITIENIVCTEPCTKLLGCGHPCRLVCHEDCKDYTCQVKDTVPTELPDCRHQLYLKCGETIETVRCSTIIETREPAGCGHIVSLPCYFERQATYEELMDACTSPCTFPTSCPHDCQGSCKTCYQGRFHVRCTAQCTRILECGHQCGSTCCPVFGCTPCQRPCEIYCEHGPCSKKCFEPCNPCMKPCTWECRHLKCGKLCSEECDREFCLEPCDQLLPCGCSCIGHCGEPCPPLCRHCDQDQLRSILLTGKEFEELGEDDRFVFLTQCKHTLEYVLVKNLMGISNDSDSSTGMRPKCCPLCRTGIWACRPFNQEIIARRKQILAAKRTLFGEDLEIYQIQLDCFYKLNVSDTCDTNQQSHFDSFRTYLHNRFFVNNDFVPMTLHFASQLLVLVKTYVTAEKYATELMRVLKQNHNVYVVLSGYRLYLTMVQWLFGILVHRPLPLLYHECLDFNREFDRISDLYRLTKCFHDPFPPLDSDYMEALDVLEDPGAYTRRLRIEFHRRFRRHWIEYCCTEKNPFLATVSYEEVMKIEDLKIDWEDRTLG